jgi:DNA (cytosine-5)-methyltransferase 1
MAVEQFFGARTAWFCEYEDAPSKVLAAHWPGVPNFGDMTRADWATVPRVRIVCGGTPCQDLSGAGKRAGMTDGTRSNLWVQMRECVAVTRPDIVIWENVRGAFSAYAASDVEHEPGLLGETYGPDRPALRALGRVLGDLSDLGYDSEWVGVRASDAGAPHARFRVFVLAYTKGVGHEWGWHAWNGRTGSAVGSLAAADTAGRGVQDGPQCSGQEHVGTFARSGDRVVGGDAAEGVLIDRRDAEVLDSTSADTGRVRGELGRDPEDMVGTRRASEGSIGGKQRDAVEYRSPVDWGQYAPAIARWERELGRVAPAPTEPGAAKNGSRRLSARFEEWMMGLPDGWVTDPDIGLTWGEQVKALGNGVVPQQALLALSILWERAVESLGVAA